jgi:hypothetical protein
MKKGGDVAQSYEEKLIYEQEDQIMNEKEGCVWLYDEKMRYSATQY